MQDVQVDFEEELKHIPIRHEPLNREYQEMIIEDLFKDFIELNEEYRHDARQYMSDTEYAIWQDLCCPQKGN